MSKGWGIVSLCFILIIGAFLPQARVLAAIGSVTISADSVNIREGPGLSYPLVTHVNKGDKFPLLAEKGEWIQLQLSSGKTGWVANWLISKSTKLLSSNSSNTGGTFAQANTNQLRIRSGPGTNFKIIGYLNKGQKVSIMDKNENWIKISSNFGAGWVSSQFLTIQNEQASSSKTSDKQNEVKTGIVTTDHLNVRNSSSLSGSILGKLSKGSVVQIYSQKNSWIEIRFSNQKGWVSSQYIDMKTSQAKSGAANTFGIIGTVTANNLHIRSSATLNGSIIGTVSKGQQFSILEETNNWARIEYNKGTFGWIAGWFLEKSTSKSSNGSGQAIKESTVTILQNGSNIRKSANINSAVLIRANAGDKFPVVKVSNDWYEIKLKNGTTGFVAGWIVSIAGPAPQIEKPGVDSYLKNKTIVIDPGHGGQDTGTTGARGTLEKKLTLRTAKLLYDKLQASGANVILTRDKDSYLSLPTRVSTSRFQQADAFLSLHYDSNTDRTVRGMTGYYYYSSQKPLAQSLYSSTQSQTRLKDRGVRFGDFHVIRENSQKATLIELGYLSNPEEELTLNSGLFQESAATGIFNGLARYFKEF
jgi:N-acetylmuramoyl-L-alanine amidase